MAEFALMAPIFFVLIFAIVDFGMGFHAWITVTNSAREGARLGAVHGVGDPNCSSGSIEDKIECRVLNTAGTLDPSNLSVDIDGAGGAPGESVVVDVDYDYTLITPLAGIMDFLGGGSIGPTLTLSSTADMRLE